MAFRRILLKLSGEALMGSLEYGTDPEVVRQLARQIQGLTERGVQVAVVLGAGNIYRGVSAAAEDMDRATADYMGMLAIVLNALQLQDALEKRGVHTRVQSALHIAASPTTRYITEEDIPEDAKQAELRVFEQQAADKPEQVRGKIAEGKLRKWMEETVLLNQVHVNADKYDGKTIEQLRAELSGTTGENVVIRRFSRFAVGA